MRVREVGTGDVLVADPRSDPVRVDDQDQQVVGDVLVVPVRDVCDLRGLGRVQEALVGQRLADRRGAVLAVAPRPLPV